MCVLSGLASQLACSRTVCSSLEWLNMYSTTLGSSTQNSALLNLETNTPTRENENYSILKRFFE